MKMIEWYFMLKIVLWIFSLLVFIAAVIYNMIKNRK